MKQVLVIAKKEFINYMTQPVGYVFAGLLVVVTNWIFLSDLFVIGQSSLAPLYSIIVFLFSIFIPAITMGLIAEEKKNGNWELLMSLPINELQVVMGKFLGSVSFLIISISLFLPTIVIMYLIGSPETGVLIGGLFGVILIGVAYLATGILATCLTDSPIVAFLTTTIFLLINNFMGQGMVVDRLPPIFKEVFAYISLATKTNNMGMGLIDLYEILFFVSWIVIAIILSTMVLKGRDK